MTPATSAALTAALSEVVANNLAYWRQRTAQVPETQYAQLAPEQGTLLRAVEFGQQLSATRPAAQALLRQLMFVIDGWGTWREWQPRVAALLETTSEALPRAQLLEIAGLACRRLRELPEALAHYQAAIALLQPLSAWYEVGRLQHGVCEIQLAQYHYAEAETAGQEALDIFVELGQVHAPQAAAAHSTLGRVALAQQQWAQAENHLNTAIALWRAHGGGVTLARALGALAQVRLAQQNFPEAVALWQTALTILAPGSHELERLTQLINLGTAFFQHRQLAEAEQYFQQADTAWLRQSPYFMHRGLVANNLGNVCLQQGRWAEAEAYLRGAAQLFAQTQDYLHQGHALGTLGEALAGQGQIAAAHTAYAQAQQCLAHYPDHAQAQQLQTKFAAQARALPPIP